MKLIFVMMLVLALNGYICLTIYLSQRKKSWLGLIPPVIMSIGCIIQSIQYFQLTDRSLGMSQGITFICLLILSIFGFILYLVSYDHYKNGTK